MKIMVAFFVSVFLFVGCKTTGSSSAIKRVEAEGSTCGTKTPLAIKGTYVDQNNKEYPYDIILNPPYTSPDQKDIIEVYIDKQSYYLKHDPSKVLRCPQCRAYHSDEVDAYVEWMPWRGDNNWIHGQVTRYQTEIESCPTNLTQNNGSAYVCQDPEHKFYFKLYENPMKGELSGQTLFTKKPFDMECEKPNEDPFPNSTMPKTEANCKATFDEGTNGEVRYFVRVVGPGCFGVPRAYLSVSEGFCGTQTPLANMPCKWVTGESN